MVGRPRKYPRTVAPTPINQTASPILEPNEASISSPLNLGAYFEENSRLSSPGMAILPQINNFNVDNYEPIDYFSQHTSRMQQSQLLESQVSANVNHILMSSASNYNLANNNNTKLCMKIVCFEKILKCFQKK